MIAVVTLAGPARAAEPPTITASDARVTVPEGTLAQTSGTYEDPGGQPVTLSASIGWVEWAAGTSSGTWHWSYPGLDGPFLSTVTITVDNGAATASVSFDVVVENQAPSVGVSGPSLVPTAAGSGRWYWWGASDVAEDTVAATQDCGSGSLIERSPTMIRCAFGAAGDTSVGVAASDEDGGAAEARTPVTATPNVRTQSDGPLIIEGHGSDSMGGAIAVTDFDGDGRGDVVTGGAIFRGSPPNPGPGYVSVIFGGAGGSPISAWSPGDDGIRILAAAADDQLGASVADAGDVNGDGFGDVLIGAPQASPIGRAFAGAAYLVFGSATGADIDLASATAGQAIQLRGSRDGDSAGKWVAGVGDVNADGYDDVAIGSPFADPLGREAAGSITVLFGAPSLASTDLDGMTAERGFLITGAGLRSIGSAIAGGDVNGDGRSDIIVGDPSGSMGWIWVVYGSAAPAHVDLAAFPSASGFHVRGAGIGSVARFGAAVASGDVNGDGFDDVIVGAPRWSDGSYQTYGTGAVYVIRGAATNASLDSVTLGPRISQLTGDRRVGVTGAEVATGTSVAVTDWDDDGLGDVLIGAPGDHNNGDASGSVFIVPGGTALSSDLGTLGPWIRIDGDGAYEQHGRVAGGDVDGDGVGDVVTGAPGWEASMPGRVAVLPGADAIPPVGSITIASGAAWSTSPTVSVATLASDAGSGVSHVSLSNDGSTWTTYPHGAALDWTLAGGDGTRTVRARWRDRAGNWSEIASDTIELETSGPSGTLAIDAGAASARSTSVTLSVAATAPSGVAAIALSNDGVSWTRVPYAASVEWTVTAGDGEKTVHARWQSAAGLWSGIVTGTITLDTGAPTASGPAGRFTTGTAVTAGRPVIRMSWTGTDSMTGVARYELEQKTDDGPYTSVAGSLTAASADRALVTGHTYRFRVRAVDRAGNAGDWAYGTAFRLRTYQEWAKAIRYSGTWRTGTSSAYWGGHDRHATARGATARLTLTGRSLAWIGAVGPTRGWARVYVNGTLTRTVNLHAASTASRRVLCVLAWKAVGTRTVTIRVSGTAGHPRVDLDALVVMN